MEKKLETIMPKTTLLIDGVETDVLPLVAEARRGAVARCIAHIRSAAAAAADSSRQQQQQQQRFRGVVDEGAVAAAGIAPTDLADALVPVAAAFARVPVSAFRVGAVLVARSGRLFLGCNAEFAGGPLSLSVHGEQAALSTAISSTSSSSSEQQQQQLVFTDLSVSALPCGHCRQLLAEYAGPALVVRVAGRAPVSLGALLPSAFTAKDLALPRLPDPARLALPAAASASASAGGGGDDAVVKAALVQAQSHSQALCSGCFAGAALLFDGDAAQVHAGAYVESVAYNPSMTPLNAAFVAAMLAGRRLEDVKRAVLVEAQAPVSNAALSRMQLQLVAPAASFECFFAELR